MISTAIIDIETSDLCADRGIILCAVIQSSIHGQIVFRTDELNKGWKSGKRGDDSEITKRIIKCFKEHDVLVAHNGNNFDIPFVRTRGIKWKCEPLLDVKIVDPCKIAWRKFRLRSNRLGNISDFIGSPDRKHPLDLSLWMDAILNGTKKSMDQIVTHCISDVKELNDVLEMVRPYVKMIDGRGSDL